MQREPPRMIRFSPPLASSRALLVALAVASLTLAGCAAGPDFKPPPSPEVGGYTAQPLAATVATPNVAGGGAQRFDAGADIPGDWWDLFHSQPLDALIARALHNNHDLKAA
ncbi:MAG: hypothetical protein KGQ32_00600, partial [Xanthomonadaceae bacterium]|nr:hypothetical protein [Xanthomonadaceae bacterium]